MKILFIGDISGRPGRTMLERNLAKVQWDNGIDFTVVNGENSSGGRGISRSVFQQYADWGIDAITTGNHVWDNREIISLFDMTDKVLRPANLAASCPGRGYGIYPCGDLKVGVINLIGRVGMATMPGGDCPFAEADRLVELVRQQTPIILVDMHAEATSEKIALSRYLDGRVSAVIGTHTHVQTNDARVLPKGTAYLTDAGMTGARDSCLGMDIPPIIERFLTGMPHKMTIAEGDLLLNGVIIEVAENGKATDIQLVNFWDNE